MTKIYIASHHGKIDETDRARAVEAAEAALVGIDAKAAYAAYSAAVEADTDPRDYSDLAAAWDRADSAANIALTEGWHDPNGASVEIAVMD